MKRGGKGEGLHKIITLRLAVKKSPGKGKKQCQRQKTGESPLGRWAQRGKPGEKEPSRK